MKNKKKNIARFFSAKLPDPEIPADDAWAKMNDMLDNENTDRTGAYVFKANRNNALKLISALFLLGLTTFGVLLFLNNNKRNKTDKAKKVTEKPLSHSTEKDKIPSAIQKNGNVVSSDGKGDKKALVTIERSINLAPNLEKSNSKKPGIKSESEEVNSNYVTPENIKSGKKRTWDEKTVAYERRSFGGFGEEGENRKGSRSKNESTTNSTTEDYKRSEKIGLLFLKSLPYNFVTFNPMLPGKVIVPVHDSTYYDKAPKRIKKSFDIGLEWNFNSPFRQADFLFTGIDSTRKPALLLIPGIYLSKSIQEKHAVILSLSAYQPYFGNNGRLGQVRDSIPGPDSSFAYRNTSLIKTFGFNAALQYQYQFAKRLTIGAGVAYSRIFGALIQEQRYSGNDEPSGSQLRTLRNSAQIGPYLTQDIIYFKAGVSYKIGRFQTGINILAPLSNVSASPQFPVRPVNGQFYLRFRVW